MTNYLPANLELLAQRQPELASCLIRASADRIEVFPSLKERPTARVTRSDAQVVPLHSRYDPLLEARQSIKKLDLAGADYFIILGFGLGYILDALLEQTGSGDNHYFIIESDAGILKAAFSARDFSSILGRTHVHFAWPASGPDLAEQWRGFFDPVNASKSIFVTHVPSLALNSSLFKSAVEVIQSQTFQIFTDINTLVGRSEVFLNNFIQNLPRAISSPGVADFVGRFAQMPAVLVAAGPSLDRNVHELRGREGNLLILAVDTALKPLLAAGVKPHFVLTGDPTVENYLHLKGADAGDALVVAEATAFPDVFVEFADRTVTCTYENSSLCSLTDLLERKGTLRAWGSVATMGLDFALALGCDPIIFIGQDLAHSEGRTYCSGVYFEESWFAGTHGPGEWIRRWEYLRAGKKTMTVEDIFGRPVETTDKLLAYRNWILKERRGHPEVRFINATEGGILREDVTICSLREALYHYSSPGTNPGHTARRIFVEAKSLKTIVADKVLIQLRSESAIIAKHLKRGIRLCREHTPGATSDLPGRLESVKNSLCACHHLQPLLNCFNQMGNITFLRKLAASNRTQGGYESSTEARKIYEEYFESVHQALGIVDGALDRLDAATFSGVH